MHYLSEEDRNDRNGEEDDENEWLKRKRQRGKKMKQNRERNYLEQEHEGDGIENKSSLTIVYMT